MPYKRKPRRLKRRNIKKKTGARAQSKQILALSKQISSLTKSNYETICSFWNRPNGTIDTLAGGTNAYICPIPISMCNCYSQNTVLTTGDADQRLQWNDNLALAAQGNYRKSPWFGSSENARDSPEITHTGSYLNYRLISTEPAFSTYAVFLIKPKRKHATQLTVDRQLKNGTLLNPTNGTAGALQEGIDFVTHPDILGTSINKKYWTVLYHRVHNFSHPGGNQLNRTVSANNSTPANNAIIQTGSCKIPGGTTIRCFNKTPLEDPNSGDMGNMKASASQIGLVDEPNNGTAYLVIVNNGVAADGEYISMSMLVKDYYKAVV